MDVIAAYLETMFSPYPQTPRLTEAKAELRAMMEDAYQAARAAGRSENEAVGQVITEFGNLDELAPVLGITAEIRPNVYDAGAASTAAPATPRYPTVTMTEAQGFAEATRRTHPKLAVAVALFVLAPCVLISLQSADVGLAAGTRTFIGIATILLLVLIGVGIILLNQTSFAQYSHISEGKFTPDPAVTAWAQNLRTQHERKRTTALIIAVPLFIASALPILAASLLANDDRLLVGAAVPSTLVIVAIGLLILIPTTWAESVAQRLSVGSGKKTEDLDNEDYPRPVRAIFAVYWPLVLIGYLVWSFVWEAWGISWIVWPIAGILSAAIAGLGNALAKD